jgi:hypothetical protein
MTLTRTMAKTDPRVFRVVGVATRAMSTRSLRLAAVAATDVLQNGDRLHMVGVDAVADAAQVVDNKSFADFSDKVGVGKTMSLPSTERAVTVNGKSGRPQPASSRSFHLRPKLLFDGEAPHTRFAASENVAVLPLSPVVLATKSGGGYRLGAGRRFAGSYS